MSVDLAVNSMGVLVAIEFSADLILLVMKGLFFHFSDSSVGDLSI